MADASLRAAVRAWAGAPDDPLLAARAAQAFERAGVPLPASLAAAHHTPASLRGRLAAWVGAGPWAAEVRAVALGRLALDAAIHGAPGAAADLVAAARAQPVGRGRRGLARVVAALAEAVVEPGPRARRALRAAWRAVVAERDPRVAGLAVGWLLAARLPWPGLTQELAERALEGRSRVDQSRLLAAAGAHLAAPVGRALAARVLAALDVAEGLVLLPQALVELRDRAGLPREACPRLGEVTLAAADAGQLDLVDPVDLLVREHAAAFGPLLPRADRAAARGHLDTAGALLLAEARARARADALPAPLARTLLALLDAWFAGRPGLHATYVARLLRVLLRGTATRALARAELRRLVERCERARRRPDEVDVLGALELLVTAVAHDRAPDGELAHVLERLLAWLDPPHPLVLAALAEAADAAGLDGLPALRARLLEVVERVACGAPGPGHFFALQALARLLARTGDGPQAFDGPRAEAPRLAAALREGLARVSALDAADVVAELARRGADAEDAAWRRATLGAALPDAPQPVHAAAGGAHASRLVLEALEAALAPDAPAATGHPAEDRSRPTRPDGRRAR